MTAPHDNALPENWDAAAAALASGAPALVWRRLIADTETPVGAGLKLIEPGRGDFLLESVSGGEVRGRYSLLGLNPDLVFRAQGHACEINRVWQHDAAAFTPLPGDALSELRALVAACHAVEPDAWRATIAGLVIAGVAGELAAAKAGGPGSFAVAILDELHNLNERTLLSRARTEIAKAK